jgi:hypothetical protein
LNALDYDGLQRAACAANRLGTVVAEAVLPHTASFSRKFESTDPIRMA